MDGWFKYARSEWDQARRVDGRNHAVRHRADLLRRPPNPTYNGRGLFPTVATFRRTPFTGTNPALTDERTYDTDTPFRTKLDDVDIFTLETGRPLRLGVT